MTCKINKIELLNSPTWLAEMSGKKVLAQFKSEEGSLVGVPLDLPLDVDEQSLGHLCNALLENVSRENDQATPEYGTPFLVDRKNRLLMSSMSMTKK